MEIKINVAEYTELDQTWNSQFHVPWMRVIRFNRLYLPCKGEGLVEGYGKSYRLRKGKMLLIPCFSQVKVSCEEQLEKYWTHFNIFPDGGQNDIFAFRQEPMELELNEEMFVFFCCLFDRVRQSCSRHGKKRTLLDDEMANSALLLLLEKFLDRIADSAARIKLPGIFEVISHMQSNLDKPIFLAELGKIAGLHPHYFSRVFKEVMGIPPELYIQKMRYQFAKLHLRNKTLSIGEVGEMTGFSSVSSFSKFFRKQEGFGPRDYRKTLEE